MGCGFPALVIKLICHDKIWKSMPHNRSGFSYEMRLKMEVVIYAHPDNKKKEDLLKMIFHKVTSKPVMIFDFERLFDLLRGKISGQLIFVFLISNENEIEVLMAARSSFFNSRTIIILPDNQNDMTQKALSLQPSYIAYINDGFEDVCAVLNKIMWNYRLQSH